MSMSGQALRQLELETVARRTPQKQHISIPYQLGQINGHASGSDPDSRRTSMGCGGRVRDAAKTEGGRRARARVTCQLTPKILTM
jgi:hypothetical protein